MRILIVFFGFSIKMEFISQYADGDDDTNQVTQEPLAKRAKIDTAPQVAPKLGVLSTHFNFLYQFIN